MTKPATHKDAMPLDRTLIEDVSTLKEQLRQLQERHASQQKELAELKAWKEKCGNAWLFLSAWWGGACMTATAAGGAVYYLYNLVHDKWESIVSTISRIK